MIREPETSCQNTDQNLAYLLRITAQNYPNKVAIIDGTRSITYSELWMMVQSLTKPLMEAGIREGACIGIRLPNSIDYIGLTYALWCMSAVVVPIAMELKLPEINRLCTTMSLQAVISFSPSEGARPVIHPQAGGAYYIAMLSSPKDHRITSAAAFIRFSSGTTGRCKGVLLTHAGIYDRIQAANKGLHITADDTIVWVLSMAHHFAATIVLFCSQGATIVLVNNPLANSIIEAVNRNKATILYAVPFHYALLSADRTARMLASLRAAFSTTTALPESLAAKFLLRYNIAIAQVYGIIELGLVCINTSHAADKLPSVGQPLPDYRIKIVSDDNDKSTSKLGTICFTGPGFFEAYCAPFTLAQDVLEDGWFNTGDIGYCDDDGFLYICGRCNDIINVAGEKVFPFEVETVLNELDCVKEACVYRETHPLFGEIAVADVVLAIPLPLNEARAMIHEHCTKNLAMYKIPAVINFVPEISKTPVTGKIIHGRHLQDMDHAQPNPER